MELNASSDESMLPASIDNAPALMPRREYLLSPQRPEPSLVPYLDNALGLTFHGLLGGGRGGTVYELSGVPGARQSRSAGKLFVSDWDAAATCTPGCREHDLARWAAQRGLGPFVYEFRQCKVDTTEGASFRVGALLMEKSGVPLNCLTLKSRFAMSSGAWREAFAVIARRDFSVAAHDSSPYSTTGWLCCDDLKPDNILVTSKGGACSVALVDWDPQHWHVTPLKEDAGRFLNRLLLILNTVLSARCDVRRTVSEWPEAELKLLQSLWTLSCSNDTCLLDFACACDKVLLRGPYHYARIKGGDRRARALTFLNRLAELGAASLPTTEASATRLARLRQRLRRVGLAFRRPRPRTCGDTFAQHATSRPRELVLLRIDAGVVDAQQDELSRGGASTADAPALAPSPAAQGTPDAVPHGSSFRTSSSACDRRRELTEECRLQV